MAEIVELLSQSLPFKVVTGGTIVISAFLVLYCKIIVRIGDARRRALAKSIHRH